MNFFLMLQSIPPVTAVIYWIYLAIGGAVVIELNHRLGG